MKQIVHFGFTDLAYCGYLLSGLHTAAAAGQIDFKVSRRLPDDLRRAAGGHENMQMISLFEASDEAGGRVRFCVDNHDKSTFVHRDLVRLVDVYFKGNHNPAAIAELDIDEVDRAKISAVGAPFAPVRVPPWIHRPPLRQRPEVGWTRHAMVRRARQLRRFPSVDYFRSLRNTPKTHDVSFAVRLYRQKHHAPINEFRNEVGHRLLAHPDIDARVAFINSSSSLVGKLRPATVSPQQHLARLASARVGIYVWGAHRCLSFKMFEQLALGLPVIGQTIPQDRANLAELKGLDEQFAYDDPAELVDAVATAVHDQDWRARMAENNATVFDDFLTPEITARGLIDEVFGQFPGLHLDQQPARRHS